MTSRPFASPTRARPDIPNAACAPTVEVTTGPLGQGIANGVGMAIAERILRSDYGSDLVDHRTWVFAGDGCFEEGVSHEAASFAGSLGLDHLTIFYDNNHITIDGATELAFHDDTEERFTRLRLAGDQRRREGQRPRRPRSGDAPGDRRDAPTDADHRAFAHRLPVTRDDGHPRGARQPVQARGHHARPRRSSACPTRRSTSTPSCRLRWSRTLKVSQEARLAWESRVEAAGAKRREAARAAEQQWRRNGDARAPEPFAAGTKAATRKAMQRAMDCYAVQTPGITAGSADLTDNTGMTLSALSVQSAANPGGRQFHYGIREFAMSANLTGQAHHGGFRPLGSTFFVFSDYARPAVRLAVLERRRRDVRLHARLGRRRRRRPDARTGRTADVAARDAAPARRAALGRERDARPRRAVPDRAGARDHGDDPFAPGRAGLQRRRRQGLQGERAHAAATSSARTPTPSSRSSPPAPRSDTASRPTTSWPPRASKTRVVALPCWRCFDAQPSDYRDEVLRRDDALGVTRGGRDPRVDEVRGPGDRHRLLRHVGPRAATS